MLAKSLSQLGQSVAVIDQKPAAFRRLGADFSGAMITGVGYEREILRQAGIEGAQAFAAVSSGDNSNIVAARTARETFGVANVVARIYDPERAAIYQRLGIPTVATVPWTADQMLRRLVPTGAVSMFQEPTGKVVLAEVPVHPNWIGRPLDELQSLGEFRIAWVTRLGSALIPTATTLYQDGDLVHISVIEAQLASVETLLAQPPAPE